MLIQSSARGGGEALPFLTRTVIKGMVLGVMSVLQGINIKILSFELRFFKLWIGYPGWLRCEHWKSAHVMCSTAIFAI